MNLEEKKQNGPFLGFTGTIHNCASDGNTNIRGNYQLYVYLRDDSAARIGKHRYANSWLLVWDKSTKRYKCKARIIMQIITITISIPNFDLVKAASLLEKIKTLLKDIPNVTLNLSHTEQ